MADTGIGIPADQCAAIFEPFQQVKQPPLQNRPGVGLGLHISARLVRLMLGEKLRVASVPGEGSRFFFALPLLATTDGDDRLVVGDQSRPARKTPGPVATDTDFALPPPAVIATLLTLSLEGDIVRLSESSLRALTDADPAFKVFAEKVDQLAVGFRMEAISKFLSQLRHEDETDKVKPG